MKKLIILALVLTLALAGCAGGTQEGMYIEKARLTEQEENIATLLGNGSDQLIYDFVLDENVQAMQLNCYRLNGNRWECIVGGGGTSFTDPKGRLALGFDDLSQGLRLALQSEHQSGSQDYDAPDEELPMEGIGRVTSALEEPTEIVYDREIPLVVQISTAQNQVYSYDLEYFFTPEEYAVHGYEAVYAITVMFSTRAVSELE